MNSPFARRQIPVKLASMQEVVSIPLGSCLDLGERPTFKVVVAYEDFEAGKNAKRVYDFLTQNLGGDCEFSNQMWKFDVLSIPRLREVATKDAYEADILMISSRGGQGLAEGAAFWIESWLAQGTRAIALVALFGGETQETKAIRSYLAEVARRGGLEFFAQPNLWPGHGGPMDEVTNRWQQAWNGRMPMPSCFAASQPEPAARWGLNE